MKPDLQRIAIAEACGWRGVCSVGKEWGAPKETIVGTLTREGVTFTIVPDYLHDLNAIHDIEVNRCNEIGLSLLRYHDLLIKRHGTLGALTASAAQRCEALLRTLGKWEEDP